MDEITLTIYSPTDVHARGERHGVVLTEDRDTIVVKWPASRMVIVMYSGPTYFPPRTSVYRKLEHWGDDNIGGWKVERIIEWDNSRRRVEPNGVTGAR